MAHRAGLARKAAAGHRADDVILALPVDNDERLLNQHAQHRAGEVGFDRGSLMMILPAPILIQTRATASLRLPVA